MPDNLNGSQKKSKVWLVVAVVVLVLAVAFLVYYLASTNSQSSTSSATDKGNSNQVSSNSYVYTSVTGNKTKDTANALEGALSSGSS